MISDCMITEGQGTHPVDSLGIQATLVHFSYAKTNKLRNFAFLKCSGCGIVDQSNPKDEIVAVANVIVRIQCTLRC